jgi:predicted house-cleaning noncanonical NTP pyrophosphatase (MazG superfamily)
MKPSYDDIFSRFEIFAKKVLTGADKSSFLNKLNEEIEELNEDPCMEELADCVLVCIGLAEHLDGNLKTALLAKIEKNEKRTWERLPNGTYHHVPKNSPQKD